MPLYPLDFRSDRVSEFFQNSEPNDLASAAMKGYDESTKLPRHAPGLSFFIGSNRRNNVKVDKHRFDALLMKLVSAEPKRRSKIETNSKTGRTPKARTGRRPKSSR